MPENPRIGKRYWCNYWRGDGWTLTIDGIDIRLPASRRRWLEKLPDLVLDGIRDACQQRHDRDISTTVGGTNG